MSTPTQTQARTTWQIDAKHSNVEFAVKHMMVTTVKGRFANVSGTIVEDAANPSNSSVDVTIDVSSVDTREEARDGHLKSPDFFHVEEHPHITFKSTKVESAGGEKLKVTGDLTIRGATHPVVLDVERNGTGTNPWGQVVAGFSAETSISRKEFGLTWNQALETGGVLVGDKIKVSLEVEAVKQG